MMCGGSPLFLFRVGEIHRVENENMYTRSPLSEPEFFLCFCCVFCYIKDVGEIHRRGDLKFNSRSPLSVFVLMFGFCIVLFCFRCRGEYTGRSLLF